VVKQLLEKTVRQLKTEQSRKITSSQMDEEDERRSNHTSNLQQSNPSLETCSRDFN
jgi:hypothetical protein